MGKFAQYLGKVTIEVDGNKIPLDKMTVEDLQELMDSSQDEKTSLVKGNAAVLNILKKQFPEEPEEELRAFVMQKYPDLTEKILVGLGWVSKEAIDAKKEEALKKKD